MPNGWTSIYDLHSHTIYTVVCADTVNCSVMQCICVLTEDKNLKELRMVGMTDESSLSRLHTSTAAAGKQRHPDGAMTER